MSTKPNNSFAILAHIIYVTYISYGRVDRVGIQVEADQMKVSNASQVSGDVCHDPVYELRQTGVHSGVTCLSTPEQERT